eukprot:gnl/MRDRNA2_/MRDRNA2_110567_c0_seq1.p1 gnl/MRDRNA2_/MRDRNA2_110567_c0~~gnl/MRDRNA2_/MRDRNA2_110567_c0_seq1.p1  ORF type:complete len:269 (+),score=42.96 gnl/MRDRNA2_/MRDRNA2_110567_c0_seq1:40-846(+)
MGSSELSLWPWPTVLTRLLLHASFGGSHVPYASAVEMGAFAKASYWDEFYTNESTKEAYDWYNVKYNDSLSDGSKLDHGGVQGLLASAGVNKSSKFLHVGCGNSALTSALWNDGFQNVVNLDISPVVVQRMSERLNFTSYEFLVGDMTNLTFENASFDVILDKGALDAVFSAGKKNGRKAIRELSRVLKFGTGRYIAVSHSEAKRRMVDLRYPHPSLSIVEDWSTPPLELGFDCASHELQGKSKSITVTGYICHRPAPLKDNKERSEL